MNKSELIQHWLDSAKEDLTVCETLFKNKHYDWCLFIGHLVLEKVLKALWMRGHFPEPHPRIHNLFKLAEKIPLELSEDQQNDLLDFNQFYLKGRYPEDKSEFYRLCTLDFAQANIDKIKKYYQWLLTKF